MELLKTRALVIHGIRWKDSSKILHLFSRERGSIKVVVKGMYRANSPFRGILENLNFIDAVISVKEGRGLQNLNHADLIHSFSGIRENLNQTAIAFSMLELIKQFIHADENCAALFDEIISLLEELAVRPEKHSMIYLYSFLISLSDFLGFGWQMENCSHCGGAIAAFPAKLESRSGSVLCGNCVQSRQLHLPGIEKLQYRLLLRLIEMPPPQLYSIIEKFPEDFKYDSLLQPLISHLGYHTDQPLQLKSLKMFMP